MQFPQRFGPELLNICLLPSPSHPQVRQLYELLEFLTLVHGVLGMRARASLQVPDLECVNVILGAHLATPDELALIPQRSVIWNTEMLADEDPFIEQLCRLAEHHTLWDASKRNCERLTLRGINVTPCQPVLLEAQRRIVSNAPKDVDVIFWGPVTPTAAPILDELEARGLTVMLASGNIGADWEANLARARLYLEVAEADDRLSLARQNFLLQNAVPVVAVWGHRAYMDDVGDALTVVEAAGAVEACMQLLADETLYEERQRAGLDWLRQQTPREFLHSIWGENQSSARALAVIEPASAANETHYFCICHVEHMFVPPPETQFIYTGNFRRDRDGHLLTSKTGLDENYRYLAGTAGTFLIAERLIESGAAGYVVPFQYRKFVAMEPLGTLSPSYHGMVLVDGSVERRPDFSEAMRAVRNEYCFAQPVVIGEIVRQYAAGHLIEDFLRFSALAVEIGVLPRSEVADFFTYPLLIPGGIEFGRFPVPVYLEIVGQMRRVCDEFMARHRAAALDHPYQGRAISFCCERLSSWLLIRHLENATGVQFIDAHNRQVLAKIGNIPISDYPAIFPFHEMFGYAHCVESSAEKP